MIIVAFDEVVAPAVDPSDHAVSLRTTTTWGSRSRYRTPYIFKRATNASQSIISILTSQNNNKLYSFVIVKSNNTQFAVCYIIGCDMTACTVKYGDLFGLTAFWNVPQKLTFIKWFSTLIPKMYFFPEIYL